MFGDFHGTLKTLLRFETQSLVPNTKKFGTVLQPHTPSVQELMLVILEQADEKISSSLGN